MTPGTITVDVGEDEAGNNYYYVHWIDVAEMDRGKGGRHHQGYHGKMDREDLEMIELLIAVLICVVLDLILMVSSSQWSQRGRPPVCQRCAHSGDGVRPGTVFSLYTSKIIYLDIALVDATLGFIGTVFVSRYLEGRL